MKTSLLALFCLSTPLWADIHTELAFSIGARTNAFRQTYDEAGLSKKIEFDHITSPTVELNALVSFNADLYLRGFWAGGIDSRHFKKKSFENNRLLSTTTGDKIQIQSALFAAGWQFDFNERRFSLCLESGLLVNHMKYQINGVKRLQTYSPFVGTLIHLPLNHRWFIDMGLDYTFASCRREVIEGVDFNKGSFQGPLGNVALGFDMNKSWSFSVEWKSHYLFTDKISLSGLSNERTKWFMNRFLLQAACTF